MKPKGEDSLFVQIPNIQGAFVCVRIRLESLVGNFVFEVSCSSCWLLNSCGYHLARIRSENWVEKYAVFERFGMILIHGKPKAETC